MKKSLVLVLALTLGIAGCAMQVHAPVPGSANAFDSDTYLSLITAKAVIDQTKVDLGNNAFPANISGNVKSAVNGAVSAYNVADTSWQAYHASATQGTATTAQQANVSQAMTNLQTAVSSVTSAKAGK